MKEIVLKKERETTKQPMEWGELTWFAGSNLANSEDMTVGQCILNPGQANPLHSHPNCSEVLVVNQGKIRHTFNNGDEVEMTTGDTITIPAGIRHRAVNTGGDKAVLFISFSSADRRTKGE
jgi:quercetin dioxygenase-like cupin family protein